MLNQATLFDSPNAISSQELEAGRTPYSSLDGQPKGRSGPDRVHASPIPLLESKRAIKTKEISGPRSSGSSASVVLTAYLVSRLKTRLATVGSMEYRQTWRGRVTPLGIAYWAHTASAHPTSGSVSTGWPSPKAKDGREWSPNSKPHQASGHGLGAVAQMAGWGSPRSSETVRHRSEEALAKAKQRGGSVALEDQVHGVISNSFHAGTGNRGALNPEHSRWLMGFPVAWGSCGATAMQSFLKLRRNS